ncbi:hypothetical protein D3C85_1711050 [compost metagenome]
MLDRAVVMEHLEFLLQDFDFGLNFFQRKLVNHHKTGQFIFKLLEFFNLILGVHLISPILIFHLS